MRPNNLHLRSNKLTKLKKSNTMELPFAESYRIKMVEHIHRSTREEREQWIKEAKYNLFKLASNQVYIDLLTDSGTGAMSDKQWAAMMLGDESYAGASSFFNMKNMIEKITGFQYVLPTHQGRAAENVFFSATVKEGNVIPGNSHFDTTKGHIEYRRAIALDCTIDEASNTQLEIPFKGNVDPAKLDKALAEHKGNVPFVIVTVTNNTAGGQPVSMQNLKEVREICNKYGEIAREMFSYADGMTMSSKKDAIVNMGGFFATNKKEWYDSAIMFGVMYEGYLTYGGMAGRDMNALAQGLDEGTEFPVLESRIKQVQYLGQRLDEFGIPYQRPAGGHAIFVDAKKILPNVPKEEFKAQTLGIELYLEAGIRGVEIGALLADRDPVTRENRYPELELLRLAIPRRTYTNNHMDVIAVALKNIYDRRESITSGYRIVKELPIMRHFTIELEKC